MSRYERNRTPLITFAADDVWAAACAAQRINGQYIKYKDNTNNVETNREIVDRLLGNPSELISDIDREMAQKVRQYYQAYTFKILQGIKLNDFENNAMLLANRDTLGSNFEIATVVSLPASHERSTKRDDVNSRITFARGGHVGDIGKKLTMCVEVLRCNYSEQYGVYFVTGITTTDSVVFFAYKNAIDVGKNINIGGTVKAHRESQTQLNRVKLF